jgi:hypothetical protein
MRLVAVTPRSGGRAAVQTFECRVCCVALTQAQEQLSRAATSSASDALADPALLACPA